LNQFKTKIVHNMLWSRS